MRKNTINFISNFKKIIQVKIDHNFFTNEDYIFTDFNPDEISELTIKNYGLIFRKIQNGFVLLSNFNERFSSKVFGGVVNLNFNFKILDSNFLNYTDIPYNNDQKFVFKNNFIKTNTGSNSKKTEYLLHENNYASSTDILEKENSLLSGSVQLGINQNDEFFGKAKKNSKLINYKINFDSRLVKLRYNLISEEKISNIKKFYVSNDENKLDNIKLYKRNLMSGKEVFSIEIDEMIKMKDNLELNYFLKKDDKFFNSFSLPLPLPKKSNISYDKKNDLFYADIFVNI
tara:strand:+ start:655 stop:1512 length:858 start_codon:yes stop_codon:yes gene_type:complete